MEHLRAQPLVREVRLNATAACLVVDHDLDNPAALIADIRPEMRGWELAENGEIVMVELDVHEESQCPWLGRALLDEIDPNDNIS
jgi:ribosomal protein S18 acetylase RimI-like enzyme